MLKLYFPSCGIVLLMTFSDSAVYLLTFAIEVELTSVKYRLFEKEALSYITPMELKILGGLLLMACFV